MVQIILYSIAAFISGVLSFMAPCTLPLLPAYFGYAGTSSKKETVRNTWFFMLGLAAMFTLLGVLAGSIGRFALMYKKELMIVSGIILIIFGTLSIIGKGLKQFNPKIQYKKTPFGAFIFGGLFGVVWAGCIGPVLGFMLVLAANTGTAITGGLLLFIHALGLLFPLLLFSLFLSKLPQNGRFWKLMKGKLFEIKIKNTVHYIHSTNIITGVLFVLLGIFLIGEATLGITKALFPQLTEWIFGMQDRIIEVFRLQ
jgi:cytochrome c-type biogenesis protein